MRACVHKHARTHTPGHCRELRALLSRVHSLLPRGDPGTRTQIVGLQGKHNHLVSLHLLLTNCSLPNPRHTDCITHTPAKAVEPGTTSLEVWGPQAWFHHPPLLCLFSSLENKDRIPKLSWQLSGHEPQWALNRRVIRISAP